MSNKLVVEFNERIYRFTASRRVSCDVVNSFLSQMSKDGEYSVPIASRTFNVLGALISYILVTRRP